MFVGGGGYKDPDLENTTIEAAKAAIVENIREALGLSAGIGAATGAVFAGIYGYKKEWSEDSIDLRLIVGVAVWWAGAFLGIYLGYTSSHEGRCLWAFAG